MGDISFVIGHIEIWLWTDLNYFADLYAKTIKRQVFKATNPLLLLLLLAFLTKTRILRREIFKEFLF